MVRLVLAMAAVLLWFGVAAVPEPARSAVQIIFVKPGASSLNSGATWATARSLQSALANAGDGSEIWVMQGTYKPTTGANRETSFVIPDGVSVLGGFGGTETIESQRSPSSRITTLSGNIGNSFISTDNSCHVVRVNPGTTDATLDGFTVASGRAIGTCGLFDGAGAYVAGEISFIEVKFEDNHAAARGGGVYGSVAPSLAGVEFIDNEAEEGGGVAVTSGGPMFVFNSEFRDNIADDDGGGIFASVDINLINPLFDGNEAVTGIGGAIRGTSVTSVGGAFVANVAANTGGAIYGGEVDVTNAAFIENRANVGAGVFVQGGPATFEDVTFSGHAAPSGGFATQTLYLNALNPTTITNVTLSNNHGTAIEMLSGDVTINNSTIADQTSNLTTRGVYIFGPSPGQLTIRNSVIWSSGAPPISASAAAPPIIENSIVQGGCVENQACAAVSSANPLLEGLANNGSPRQTRRLPPGSTAVDAGNDATCAPEDARGVARTVDGDTNGAVACDLGAYELDDLLVGFTRSSATRGEGVGSVAVGLALSKPAAGEVTVNVAADGPAGDQADYSPVADSVTFSPGTTAGAVAVTLANDYLVEPSEEILLTLSDATGGAAILREESTLVIKDNEPRGKCNGQPATMAGNSNPNTITGTTGPDIIIGLGGNDAINGRGGNDLICGGNGNDVLNGGPGLDAIFGANGADRITGGGANDFLRGQAQADSITGGGGNDDMRGGGGNDTLGGGPGGDTLLGERGADRVDGGNGNDRLSGGPGRPDRCDGGPGTDALLASHGCEVRAGVP